MIINISFVTGKFPGTKQKLLLPFFRKGNRLYSSNNRPISVLSNISKIFEKTMYSRLSKFLDCLYKKQFGFTNVHSTNHGLIIIAEEIRKALDNTELSSLVVFFFTSRRFLILLIIKLYQ